jgi:hypothetical protein
MKTLSVSKLILFISLITGCSVFSPPLVIETINVDSQERKGVAAVEVEVFDQKTEMQFRLLTDEKGMVKFPRVKNKEFRLTVSGGGIYFPVDTLVVMNNMKEPFALQLEEIKTILIGSVFEDSTYRGIEGCIIMTDPGTVESMSNSSGQFVLKSKKFTNTPYTIKAMHDDYLNDGDAKSIRLTLNQRNSIPAIILSPKPDPDAVKLTTPNPPPTPPGSGEMYRE